MHILLFLFKLCKTFFILIQKFLLLLFITVFRFELKILCLDSGILKQFFRFMFDSTCFGFCLIEEKTQARVMASFGDQRGNACTREGACERDCDLCYHRFYLCIKSL